MSSHHNRRKRRATSEIPMLIERLQKTEQSYEGSPRLSYEEANWAKLSPNFRMHHNRLRQARGLPTLPPPKIDQYVAPQQPLIKPFDPTDKEFIRATREFLGPTLMGVGEEGFTVDGKVIR